MQSEFLAAMENFGLSDSGMSILVGVSGGVDSMVLATLLYENKFSISVAHCNYRLRGLASDHDEELVKKWCSDREVPFYSRKVDTQLQADSAGHSIQMVARKARYAFFEQLLGEHNLGVTALAHHANDRVESLLINVLRGTGIRGLQGMPSSREGIIRPLIRFTKQQILTFAKKEGVSFRNDASNMETYYQRNWVRLRLLPMLEQTEPNTLFQLKTFCERVESELPNYESWLETQSALLVSDNKISLTALQTAHAPFTLLKEKLQSKGFSSEQVFEVMQVLDSSSGTEVHSETHRVVKDRENLLLVDLGEEPDKPILQFEAVTKDSLETLKTLPSVALLNAEMVSQPNLVLRKWRQGDRFKPLGMKGWKKLSDFFIDEKLSVFDKEQVWVLTSDNEIVWVVGKRLDNRFKILESTQKVLKVTVSC